MGGNGWAMSDLAQRFHRQLQRGQRRVIAACCSPAGFGGDSARHAAHGTVPGYEYQPNSLFNETLVEPNSRIVRTTDDVLSDLEMELNGFGSEMPHGNNYLFNQNNNRMVLTNSGTVKKR